MVNKDQIIQLVNPRLNHILRVAESSLHPGQFKAFRKLTLDDFGENGLRKDLDKLFSQSHNDRKG